MARDAEDDRSVARPIETNDMIEEIIYRIRLLIQAEGRHSKALNKEFQVSGPQLNCLKALFKSGPLPPSQIAREILVESSTVTGIIDRLEQKGFVKRVRSAQDRRKIFIEMTNSGRALAAHAPPSIQVTLHEGLRRLERDKLEAILDGLSILTGLLAGKN